QIEMQVIGAVYVIAARIPRIEIDAAEIDDPEQGTEILDDGEIDDAFRGMLNGAYSNPSRTWRRRAFHEEKFTGSPVRVTLHDHGAVLQVRQQVRRNIRVILQKVAFRNPQLRPKRLLQVG